MNNKTRIFKPGDIVYFTSSAVRCSCLTEIVSVTQYYYKCECILYHPGTGFGKTFDRGCKQVNIHDVGVNAWKVSRSCCEFLKLFMEKELCRG